MNTETAIIKYLQIRSCIINFINDIKDNFRSIIEVLGKEGDNPTVSLYFRYLIIRALIYIKDYISNIMQLIDKKYDHIQITDINNGLLVFDDTTIEDVILGKVQDNLDIIKNNRVYIKYSLDDKLCLKNLLIKYSGAKYSSIKVILRLNNIPHNDDSKVHMRYMEAGKMVTCVQKIE